MTIRDFRLRTIFILIAVLAVCSACGKIRFRDCQALNSIIPTAPIFSNSTLLRQGDSSVPTQGVIWHEYETYSTPQDIIDFYESLESSSGTCLTPVENGKLCTGKAEPFGRYSIALDITEHDPVTYRVTVSWEMCIE